MEPTETSHPHPPIGRRQKVPPRAPDGAAYATAQQLVSLGAFLDELTTTAGHTGWHVNSMVVSYGDETAADESIVVGVRWINGAYHAEIR